MRISDWSSDVCSSDLSGGKGNNGEAQTLAGGKVTVPARIWKVALLLPNGDNDLARVTTQTKVIAVDMPNTNHVNNEWKAYRINIQDRSEESRVGKGWVRKSIIRGLPDT